MRNWLRQCFLIFHDVCQGNEWSPCLCSRAADIGTLSCSVGLNGLSSREASHPMRLPTWRKRAGNSHEIVVQKQLIAAESNWGHLRIPMHFRADLSKCPKFLLSSAPFNMLLSRNYINNDMQESSRCWCSNYVHWLVQIKLECLFSTQDRDCCCEVPSKTEAWIPGCDYAKSMS